MKKILTILIFTLAAHIASAQGQVAAIVQNEFKTKADGFSEAWKNVKNGNKYFDTEIQAQFAQALPYYLEAFIYNSKNPELNYRIGV